MLLIFLRSIILFIVLLIVMRFMGKRQIGQMQPFELVITLVIAELICIPMADTSIPLMHGVIAVLSLLFLHQLLSLIDRNSISLRRVLCGRPTIVITPDGIDFKKLKSLGMSVSDLLEVVRSAGYFSIDQVQYGIFETNGSFSVLEKNNKKKQDLEEMPLTIIENGKIVKNSLKMLEKDKSWVYSKLDKLNIPKLKDVLFAMVSSDGKFYLQEKNKKPVIKEHML